ncbi:2-C-methyl-D-erythritol 4-phosphate cytidylyltransferase [Taibaiella koreensis]|uniref:2-C-methyl-D-erythritol 4-phosphate cytidylyltransferase n=1 Tax=Taibaiella koreensis TaxID=1268548 RepID=UPI001F08D926|nr:2-C-methyl-D-erythritol 4-phosphate cytidylyltransferase [Taibaiella koreensis]
MSNLSTTLILVAGGKGLRMGAALPKQFLPLLDKPILYYAAKTFLDTFPGIKIVLVLPEEHISYSNILLQAFEERIDMTIVKGGDTRFHSVRNGLNEAIPGSIVFIHDAVRPLIDKELLLRCYNLAVEKGNAIPAIPVTDSIRQWKGTHFEAIDRDALRIIQTPQTFRAELIVKAFEQDYHEAFTDEATVLEHMKLPVFLTEGSKKNIKITTPEDLRIAEVLMQQH